MRLFIALVSSIFCFCVVVNFPMEQPQKLGAIEWRSPAEKKDFYRLLRKHGLYKKISVIVDDGKNKYYFNSRGEKCLFK